MSFITHLYINIKDFGFVFGKDPKPYPSPFRLTKEMAVAIGGEAYQTSDNFAQFKSYCYQVRLRLYNA